MEGEGEGGRCRERERERGGIPRERKQRTDKIVQETGEKERKKKKKQQTDKQEKNRKPVNQGKSYTRDCPAADL